MTKSVQLFKVAGLATLNGSTKVCFSDNIVRRIKQYAKAGSTRIDFVELPSEMTKIEAIKYLQTHEEFQTPSDQATLSESLEVKTKEAEKQAKVVSVTQSKPKTKTTKVAITETPSLEKIKARIPKDKVPA